MPVITMLTPLMLATTATTALFEAPTYDHSNQIADRAVIEKVQYQTLMCMSTSTFNGTQTYGYDGQPSDNDADQDHQGDC